MDHTIVSRNDPDPDDEGQIYSMRDLIDRIAQDETLDKKRRSEICSGIRTLLKALGLQPEDTPCEPRLIADRLKGTTPASLKLSKARIQNCKSLVDAAFKVFFARFTRKRSRSSLNPAFAAVMKLIPDRWDRHSMVRLFHLATELQVEPGQIDSNFFDLFSKHLKLSTIENITSYDQKTRKAWNRLCHEIPNWPGKPVSVPSYIDHYVLSENNFPESFVTELDAYLKSRQQKATTALDSLLSEEELFGDTAGFNRSAALIRPSTAKLVRYRVRQFASILVNQDILKREKITNLAVLVSPKMVSDGLMWLVRRNDGGFRNSQIKGIASDLYMIAKLWVRSPAEHLGMLQNIISKVRPDFDGLAESARRSLAPFRAINNVRAFLELPERVIADIVKSKVISPESANKFAAALWIKIAQRAPLRISNLVGIDLVKNVLRSHQGKNASVSLYFKKGEIKNDKVLEVPLPASVVALIDLFVEKYRGQLVKAPSNWLFPVPDGRHKRGSVISADIQKLMMQYVGFSINPHSFRHVAATLYLKVHPGRVSDVQLILGHKKLETTLKYYADLSSEEAFNHFDEVLLGLTSDTRLNGNKI